MASLNKCCFIGRLGHDPEVKYLQSGQAVANISIAIDESYKDQSGQKVEKTEWVRGIVWGKQAEFCANYLSKGRLVYVEGKLETRKWQDKEGVDRTTTEIRANIIQALDPKRDESKQAAGGYASGSPAYGSDEMDDAPF